MKFDKENLRAQQELTSSNQNETDRASYTGETLAPPSIQLKTTESEEQEEKENADNISSTAQQESAHDNGCGCPDCGPKQLKKGPYQLKEDEDESACQLKEGAFQLKEEEDENACQLQAAPFQLQEGHNDGCGCPDCGAKQLKKSTKQSTTATKSKSSSSMPDDVQAKMEQSFNQDFSNVNIHANSQQASDLGALAYTQGSDIHFAPGEYSPHSESGQELLGHELTHTIQQQERQVSPTVQKKGVAINDDSQLEKEADDFGKKAAKGESIQRKASSSTASPKIAQLSPSPIGAGEAEEEAPEVELSKEDKTAATEAAASEEKEKTNPESVWHIVGSNTWVYNYDEKAKKMLPAKDDKKAQIKMSQGAKVDMLSETPITIGKKSYFKVKSGETTGYVGEAEISQFRDDIATQLPKNKNEQYSPSKGVGNKKSRQRSRNRYKAGAPNANISNNEARGILKVAFVTSGSANKRKLGEDSKTYDPISEKIKKGTPLLVLEETEQTRKGKNEKIAKVIDFEGNECYTWTGNYSYKSALPKSLPEIKSDVVKEALIKQYNDSLDELLKKKTDFSENQKTLLSEARAFSGDTAAQGKIPNKVKYKGSDLSLEGTSLNADLVQRMDVFFKFLISKDLIFNTNVTANDGMRSKKEAHKWSTAWHIRNNRISLSKLKGLKDGKDEDGILWYDKAADNVYKESKGEGGEKPKKVLDEAETMKKIQTRARGYWKGAYAAEGYKKGDSKRNPNGNGANVSNHTIGEAIDISLKYKINAFDPIIDALSLAFGLYRPVKEGSQAESWHFERVGMVKK